MKNIYEKIINIFIHKNLIAEEEKELYICGLEQIILYIVNIVTMIILGITFKLVLETILFILTYIYIRIYAGGYHCRTPLKCYIFSVLMLVVVLSTLKGQALRNPLIITVISIISSIIILSLAPIEDENKPLDEIEIKVYEKRTTRNLLIVLSLLLLTLILNKINLSAYICISLLCNGIMLMLGKINNSIRYKYSK
ncbi:accessory gene regulator B family protein [uncultured Tyzzerella sp.]|uniref:accessory gene regulator ArgB-like protein n=1 Tax=uncultured Tyzzerella sp. TaxID=2321398 RepID=UPI002942E8A6|nr:accessory gene regulator B family protein [uncultured Tyzzerella sp.]